MSKESGTPTLQLASEATGRCAVQGEPAGAEPVTNASDQGSPIGLADPLGPDRDGNAEFRLAVGGKLPEGRWLLVGRVFVRAHEDGR
jgi:hypothetical protein